MLFCVQSISHVWFFVTPWTVVAHQAALSMKFSRKKYWSGLPFPSPGDPLDPGIDPGSPALQQILYCLRDQCSLYFIQNDIISVEMVEMLSYLLLVCYQEYGLLNVERIIFFYGKKKLYEHVISWHLFQIP